MDRIQLFLIGAKFIIKKRKDLNQKVVSSSLGLSKSYLSHILNLRRKVSAEHYFGIVSICQMPIDAVIELGQRISEGEHVDIEDFYRGPYYERKARNCVKAYQAALNYFLDDIGHNNEITLASEVGISHAYFERIKTGEEVGTISIEVAHAIAHALDSTYEGMLAVGRNLLGLDTATAKAGTSIDIQSPLNAMDTAIRILQTALKVYRKGGGSINKLACPFDTFFEDYGSHQDIEIDKERLVAILMDRIETLQPEDQKTLLRFVIRLQKVNPLKAAYLTSSEMKMLHTNNGAADGYVSEQP